MSIFSVLHTKLGAQWDEFGEVQHKLWDHHNKMKELSDNIRNTIDDIRQQVAQARDWVDVVQVRILSASFDILSIY